MKELCFFVFFIPIFFYGCKEKNELDDGTVISIRYSDSVDLIDSAFVNIESVQLVYLHDSLGLIGEVDRLIVTDDRYIVLDKSQKTIWIYTKEGRLISKINKVGRGAGEYSNTWSLITKTKNEIGIIDDEQRSILWYDELGNFINRVILSGYPVDALVNGDNLYVMFRHLHKDIPTEENYYLHCLGLNSEFQRGYLEFRNPMLYGVSQEYLIKKSDKCFFSFPFENKLFSITNSQLSVVYSFDFGQNPNSINKIREAETANDLNEVLSSIRYYGNAHSFQLTDDYLTFIYSIWDGSSHLTSKFIYNIESGDYMNFNGVIKSGLDVFYTHPLASDCNFFYSIVYPYTINDKTREVLGIKKPAENSNPIIMMYKYRI